MDNTESAERYALAKSSRQKHLSDVVDSESRKRIVVAGPGTGKTHLFKEVLRGKQDTLTLSFINALVDDLALELCGLSDVKTLHSFARAELARSTKKKVQIFAKLSSVITEDADVLLPGTKVDFDHIFQTRDDGNELIPFYKKRKDYYGFYGMSDVVFAIVKYWESAPHKIPKYEQVVVDEFQDFNKLEVSLIDLLAEQSPILLAGDDDQALYDFKHASAAYIRNKHAGEDDTYSSFCLPYCSRSTRVIVDAANDIVNTASGAGLLRGRIPKRYDYFDDEDKDKESARHPKIAHIQAHANQIPWAIEEALADIALIERRPFSTLIVSPTRTQIAGVVKKLEARGCGDISFVEKRGEQNPSLVDALGILLADGHSNLGWRIAAKCLLSDSAYVALVTKSNAEDAPSVESCVDIQVRKRVRAMVALLRKVTKEKGVSEEHITELYRDIGGKPATVLASAVRALVGGGVGTKHAAIRRLPIKATTIQSSKGLAADYVFITHFDDRYFIGDKGVGVSNKDVCSFLVALTRARKKVFLISPQSAPDPTFLGWIKAERIERLDP